MSFSIFSLTFSSRHTCLRTQPQRLFRVPARQLRHAVRSPLHRRRRSTFTGHCVTLFPSKASPHSEQGFFALQTRLLYNTRKPCLRCNEALFENGRNAARNATKTEGDAHRRCRLCTSPLRAAAKRIAPCSRHLIIYMTFSFYPGCSPQVPGAVRSRCQAPRRTRCCCV